MIMLKPSLLLIQESKHQQLVWRTRAGTPGDFASHSCKSFVGMETANNYSYPAGDLQTTTHTMELIGSSTRCGGGVREVSPTQMVSDQSSIEGACRSIGSARTYRIWFGLITWFSHVQTLQQGSSWSISAGSGARELFTSQVKARSAAFVINTKSIDQSVS